MSVRVVSVELEPGGPPVLAEIRGDEIASEDAYGRAADPRQLLERGTRSVREAVDELVVPSARVLMGGLRSIQPSSIEVEFGLKLSGQAGLLFASTGAEGNITVRLNWDSRVSSKNEMVSDGG